VSAQEKAEVVEKQVRKGLGPFYREQDYLRHPVQDGVHAAVSAVECFDPAPTRILGEIVQ
jgi:hypothetical protein